MKEDQTGEGQKHSTGFSNKLEQKLSARVFLCNNMSSIINFSATGKTSDTLPVYSAPFCQSAGVY